MKRINSEEPTDHWPFLTVKSKTVLDLGCSKFYSSISTAQWFLDQGAERVIGVDFSKESIEDSRFIPYAKAIQSEQDLRYFFKYDPQVIKCDIEGAERYFDTIEQLPHSVTELAIEYHDGNLKSLCENAIKRWGFPNVDYYQLFNEDINRIGVLHAWM